MNFHLPTLNHFQACLNASTHLPVVWDWAQDPPPVCPSWRPAAGRCGNRRYHINLKWKRRIIGLASEAISRRRWRLSKRDNNMGCGTINKRANSGRVQEQASRDYVGIASCFSSFCSNLIFIYLFKKDVQNKLGRETNRERESKICMKDSFQKIMPGITSILSYIRVYHTWVCPITFCWSISWVYYMLNYNPTHSPFPPLFSSEVLGGRVQSERTRISESIKSAN